MNGLYFVFVVAAMAVAGANGRTVKGAAPFEEHPIGWYDCSGKPDGNYEHPTKCTKFISCSGGVASLRECAQCHVDPLRCPEGQTVYDPSVDACLWADETTCSKGDPGPSTTEENPDPSTTEENPDPSTTQRNPEPSTTEENPATTPEQTPEPTTEDNSDPGTTESNNPRKPKPGEPCNPEECINDGWCQWYFRCDNETRTWVQINCGQDLVWNPRGPASIHGGNCDFWSNLDQDLVDQYRSHEDCLACFWKQQGNCNRKYLYQAPKLLNRKVEELECSEGLVFVQAKETCQRCEDVDDEDGNPCCGAQPH